MATWPRPKAGKTMPGEMKGDSHQIWRIRTQRVQVNVASLRLFLRSSTGPNRAFEPQSLESLGRIRGGFAGSEPFSGFRSRKPETDPDACHSTPITRPSRLLRIDHRESLEQGDVAKSLIGANEMIDRGGRLNRQGHSELNRVEGVNLPRLPVLCDEISGPGLAQNL